jgi:hypothetical protein
MRKLQCKGDTATEAHLLCSLTMLFVGLILIQKPVIFLHAEEIYGNIDTSTAP